MASIEEVGVLSSLAEARKYIGENHISRGEKRRSGSRIVDQEPPKLVKLMAAGRR